MLAWSFALPLWVWMHPHTWRWWDVALGVSLTACAATQLRWLLSPVPRQTLGETALPENVVVRGGASVSEGYRSAARGGTGLVNIQITGTREAAARWSLGYAVLLVIIAAVGLPGSDTLGGHALFATLAPLVSLVPLLADLLFDRVFVFELDRETRTLDASEGRFYLPFGAVLRARTIRGGCALELETEGLPVRLRASDLPTGVTDVRWVARVIARELGEVRLED